MNFTTNELYEAKALLATAQVQNMLVKLKHDNGASAMLEHLESNYWNFSTDFDYTWAVPSEEVIEENAVKLLIMFKQFGFVPQLSLT
jgi:hypothetical protein